MTKSRFDSKSLVELVEFLKSERTGRGDKIILHVKYKGLDKPECALEFMTTYPEFAMFPKTEDISDWLPETSSYDSEDGSPIPGGYSNWRDLIDQAVGPTIRAIVSVGGRDFEYKEGF